MTSNNGFKITLSKELDDLYKSLTEIRSVIWSSKKLDFSFASAEEQNNLIEHVRSVKKNIYNFVHIQRENYYRTSIEPGSLVLLTSYMTPMVKTKLDGTIQTVKIQTGDIFLYLGLTKDGIPRWLINNATYEQYIPVNSFKVLNKNIKAISSIYSNIDTHK